MNNEERLAVATELLRQAEQTLDPPWLGENQLDIRRRRRVLRDRIKGFLDAEFKEMGIPNRQAIYERNLNGSEERTSTKVASGER